MLNLYVSGERKDEIYNTSVYFDSVYSNTWFEDEFAQRMILDIEKSQTMKNVFINEIVGVYGPRELCGGVKTVLLMKNMPSNLYNLSTCGDNMVPYIKKVTDKIDITCTIHHVMNFGDNFKVRIINYDEPIIIENDMDTLSYHIATLICKYFNERDGVIY